ncbi:nischarin-like [Sitophilus oryzae]|uniref:Nischarin-like n=1 Tax=Sitophilus oryzae TaxID=7048 RepID=A0A6J2XC21_SITOR|nr:nischarin-like [Sitophilus oryzae]
MACLWSNSNEVLIQIPLTEEIDNVTFYQISVKVGEIKWNVKHRYSEFYNLHNQLITDHGVSKDILPSKKVIGNKSEPFIENRRKALEKYVQKIFIFLRQTMPKIFVDFLDFHLYDIYFLLQDLSLLCFTKGDLILSSSRVYSFKPIELYAINEFLKSPAPNFTNSSKQLDLGPILDLCSQLDAFIIHGCYNDYLKSNIILNKLPIDLSPFKIQKGLYLSNVSLDMVTSLGNARETVTTLEVVFSNVKRISDILQCDILHKNTLEESQKWKVLETLDLSNNNLMDIDESINLAKNLKHLILDNNYISTVSDLTQLPNLENLSIENNLITVCNDLHRKIGNIKTLNLSLNNIVTGKGFYKLYSLETLNLSSNKITNIEELECLGRLPCLEYLVLNGNNVSSSIDYRVKVLEFFGERAADIYLDNEKPSEAELDKVSILSALRIVKEGKTPDLSMNGSS